MYKISGQVTYKNFLGIRDFVRIKEEFAADNHELAQSYCQGFISKLRSDYGDKRGFEFNLLLTEQKGLIQFKGDLNSCETK